MDDTVHVRLAKPDDAPTIAWHRARMFADMGELSEATFDALRVQSERSLRTMLESGEYVGWLAAPAGQPVEVIAGAGVQRRRVLPHPSADPAGGAVAEGRHAIVVNVYTEPAWRRRGVAELLMNEVLDWARAERLDRLVLHASEAGRPLYARLGFVPTSEMRLAKVTMAGGQDAR